MDVNEMVDAALVGFDRDGLIRVVHGDGLRFSRVRADGELQVANQHWFWRGLRRREDGARERG